MIPERNVNLQEETKSTEIEICKYKRLFLSFFISILNDNYLKQKIITVHRGSYRITMAQRRREVLNKLHCFKILTL